MGWLVSFRPRSPHPGARMNEADFAVTTPDHSCVGHHLCPDGPCRQVATADHWLRATACLRIGRCVLPQRSRVAMRPLGPPSPLLRASAWMVLALAAIAIIAAAGCEASRVAIASRSMRSFWPVASSFWWQTSTISRPNGVPAPVRRHDGLNAAQLFPICDCHTRSRFPTGASLEEALQNALPLQMNSKTACFCRQILGGALTC